MKFPLVSRREREVRQKHWAPPQGDGGSARRRSLRLADADRRALLARAGLLAVADLHLEKGSSFAARGQLLPPYDTAATLARLARLIAHYAPRVRGGARRQFP